MSKTKDALDISLKLELRDVTDKIWHIVTFRGTILARIEKYRAHRGYRFRWHTYPKFLADVDSEWHGQDYGTNDTLGGAFTSSIKSL